MEHGCLPAGGSCRVRAAGRATRDGLCGPFESGRRDVTYEQKFANFIRMCEDKDKLDVVFVAYPWVLGDSYEEIVESLSRLADAELTLVIGKRAGA